MEILISGEITMQSKKKNVLLLCASFLLPCLIITAALAALKVTPFGDNMLLFGDSYYYDSPWLSYLATIFTGEHSIYYSFSDGIGSNIAYSSSLHVFNPNMILFYFAGWDYIPQAFTVAVILNTSLCGLTMYIFLAGILGHKLSNLIFSTSYALMGFMVLNNYNLLFHIGPAMLPLMTYGLVSLIKDKKILLYILSIAYTIISGFQMGFIICMASLFFFVAYMYIYNESLEGNRKNILIRYGVSSLAAGFLGAVIWIPAFFSCKGRTSLTELGDFTLDENGPILQMAAKLFSGASSTSQIINGYPVIFCGILPIILTILYYMNKNISKREKIGISALLLIYGLSFYIKAFQTIFQGFTKNIWFNHRQSFIFSFLMIYIAVREFEHLEEIEIADIKKSFVILIISMLLIFSVSYEFISGGNAVVDIAILLVIGGGFLFYKKHPERADKKSLILLVLICVSLQLYINYYTSEHKILSAWGKSVNEFQQDIIERQPLVNAVQTSDNGFYRMEIEDQMMETIGHDAAMFHYNGVGHATYSPFFTTLGLQKMGLGRHDEKSNSYEVGVNAATDSLLGIKYLISPRDLTEEKNYERMIGLLDNELYKNPYALDILILSNNEIDNVSIEDEKDIFFIQNNIWKSMTGESEDIFIKEEEYSVSVHNRTENMELDSSDKEEFLEEMGITGSDDTLLGSNLLDAEAGNENRLEESGSAEGREAAPASSEKDEYGNEIWPNESYIEVTFEASRDGAIYMYDSAAMDEQYGSQSDAIKYLGIHKKGDTVKGRLYFDTEINRMFLGLTLKELCIYYEDMETLRNYSAILQGRESTITKISDINIEGSVKADTDKTLLFTIPYDEGWKLKVDGEPAITEKTADLFLSAKVTAGEHTYELKYDVPGLTLGICLSIAAFINTCVLVFFFRNKN